MKDFGFIAAVMATFIITMSVVIGGSVYTTYVYEKAVLNNCVSVATTETQKNDCIRGYAGLKTAIDIE